MTFARPAARPGGWPLPDSDPETRPQRFTVTFQPLRAGARPSTVPVGAARAAAIELDQGKPTKIADEDDGGSLNAPPRLFES
eukprot:222221-Hanusia_phi.AAC.1